MPLNLRISINTKAKAGHNQYKHSRRTTWLRGTMLSRSNFFTSDGDSYEQGNVDEFYVYFLVAHIASSQTEKKLAASSTSQLLLYHGKKNISNLVIRTSIR